MANRVANKRVLMTTESLNAQIHTLRVTLAGVAGSLRSLAASYHMDNAVQVADDARKVIDEGVVLLTYLPGRSMDEDICIGIYDSISLPGDKGNG